MAAWRWRWRPRVRARRTPGASPGGWCLLAHALTNLFFPPEEAALLLPRRLLRYELQRALCETHLWLSLFQRPPRSPFTRLQRATCCTLLLQLLVLANTLWYSIVVDTRSRCLDSSSSSLAPSVCPSKQYRLFFWGVFFVFCSSGSPQPVSRFASLSGETVAAGVLTCLLVYPLYLLVFTLFRMSRSKVGPQNSAVPPPQARSRAKWFYFVCLWT